MTIDTGTIDAGTATPASIPAAVPRARPRPTARRPQWPGHAVMAVLSLFCVFPVYWMLVTSLRPDNAIFDPTPWPVAPTLGNSAYALDEIPVLRMLWNTALVSGAVTAIQLFTGLLAGYAFVFWRFRFGRLALTLITLTWLIPLQVVMIPNFLLVVDLGLLDSVVALILPHFASALAVLLMVQALRAIPREMVEAARMDGAGSWRILWRVLVPNLRGMLASLALLVFISTWNEYFWPLLLSRTPENTVIQIGIQMFITAEGNQWGPLMAASTMASLPILAVYLCLQRQVIQSFMQSGLR